MSNSSNSKSRFADHHLTCSHSRLTITCLLITSLWLKVLSMSRLGATEAVVPLLTESQTKVNYASLNRLL